MTAIKTAELSDAALDCFHWVRYDDHAATLASAAQPTSIGGPCLASGD